MSPFPKVIRTRIHGCKEERQVRDKWVILKIVRPELPNVIWVHWIRRVGERPAYVEKAALGAKVKINE